MDSMRLTDAAHPTDTPDRLPHQRADDVTQSRLKVSSHSDPYLLATKLIAGLRVQECVELQPASAAALSRAVNCVAIARGFLATTGTDLVCRPAFSGNGNGESAQTQFKLLVEFAPPAS